MFLRPPSLTGLLTGFVFMAASLVPSLLPRPWYVQGAIVGLALAFGYGVGSTIAFGWHRLRGPTVVEPSRATVFVVLAAPMGLVIWMLVIHLRWQSDIRVLMDMERGVWLYLAFATFLGLALGSVLVLIGRGVGWISGRLRRLLVRMMPGWMAILSMTVVALVGIVVFYDLVVASWAIPSLEAAHRRSDRSFDPGVKPPESSFRSGSAESLIDWERMGRQGRVFVTETPSPADLEAFSGVPAIDPIRIYVGLQVADTAESRARLALAEMERTGAFQREVIVLVAPTGSGWIDPYAIGPLEYMYAGDTAAVAVQYSYLASWLVMIQNQDIATDASAALYRVVSRRIQEEPESSRPKLLLYGESLGSFGWERTFAVFDDVVDGSDGALWVGPPRVNPLWRRLMSGRDAGSPIWRPIYEGGKTVRFGPDVESLLAPGARWTEPRIVYLQHASDPITWLSLDVFFDKPEWLDPPRGPDVSAHMPYVPVVTYFQMVIDLILGTNAPVGHGHKFGPAQAEAWSLILPPPGWTIEDAEALVAVTGP
ncbi:MAG TPA: alpha/beta-hydrolase family protein [Acidimicrobiia bacterium]|nr:alpha/beta-hydrolase family protein [Acidimicrobiia bacterium]